MLLPGQEEIWWVTRRRKHMFEISHAIVGLWLLPVTLQIVIPLVVLILHTLCRLPALTGYSKTNA